MDLQLLNEQGQAGTFAAPDTVFGRDYNEALIHQIVRVEYVAPTFRHRNAVHNEVLAVKEVVGERFAGE